jgi:hypothetical protein
MHMNILWQRSVTYFRTYSRVCVHRALDVKASTSFMHVLYTNEILLLKVLHLPPLHYAGQNDKKRHKETEYEILFRTTYP